MIRSLGYEVADWIEDNCVIPDGERMGNEYKLTHEMLVFLRDFYEVNEDGSFRYRRGQLVRPQKWGKGPFSAAMICAEAYGPVLFSHWGPDGQPRGKPWASPHIQITAVSEDQTANVWRALQPMIELGGLAADIPDTGLTRINLPGGGLIEPVTASARSRLGQRITFAVQDEALALNTLVPTPSGWSMIGHLVEGDKVIGADGQPCTVLGATEVQTDRQCYRVSFADGSSITASDGHLWMTKVRGSAAKPAVRTTGQMVEDGRTFRVPAAQPLTLPPVDLPVDPYLLGYWLGDGSTGQPNITVGDEDINHLRQELHRLGLPAVALKVSADRAARVSFSSGAGYQAVDRPDMVKRLQSLDCYRSKHIPAEYMRASREQRESLMQGLMDSDGHVTATGHCTFVGNRQLAHDFAELARTLGQYVRPVFRPDTRAREGGTWKVNFVPRGDVQPFRLPRKAQRVRPARRGADWVTVTSILPVESVPVRCIKVSAPDSLFLAGDGHIVTHNTHSWLKSNGGRALADNQRRNLAGMKGRSIETTNAWDPAEQSVAQQTWESDATDILKDMKSPRSSLSVRNKRERMTMLREVYADSAKAPDGWVDLDRIDAEVVELIPRDAAQAERFFCNRIVAAEDAFVSPAAWEECRHPDGLELPPDGDAITLGFDGSLYDDTTGLLGCHVDTGHLFVVDAWDPADHGGEVPKSSVDVAVRAAFDRWDVRAFYGDPPYWQEDLGRWYGAFGDVVKEWWTNRPKFMADALELFHTSVATRSLSHDGDARLAAHVGNARRFKDRGHLAVRKKFPQSPEKIDLLICAVLALEARNDVLRVPAVEEKRPGKLLVF